jgi:hypothetical protein
MGAETTCPVTVNGKTSTARVRFETNVLQVRGGELKLDVPFTAMKKVVARDGVLSIARKDGALTLALGTAAGKWADKILHPPSRLKKLGVGPGWRVSIVGHLENEFVDELRAAVTALTTGRIVRDADAVFVSVTRPKDFTRLDAARRSIKPAGAVWIIRPKGGGAVTEGDVMAAGKAAGLVDVKVVGFSPTHSALKFVIPVRDRRLT